MFTSLVSLANELAAGMRWADLLDIGVISVVLYGAFVWLSQAASRAAGLAVILIALLYAAARLLGMYLTLMLFQIGLTVILLALVVVFQEDIRRLFERIRTWGARREDVAPARAVDILTEAASAMAAERTGALMVLKRRESLERHLHGGVPVQGRLSLPLLYSIFHPQSPGHDGAIVVEGERIEQLSVHLPLSTDHQQVAGLGTRHAAALGLAERSDALVVVVSEERGAISIAERGKLTELESAAELKQRLEDFYQQLLPPPPALNWRLALTQRAGVKFASLLLASLLWLMFVFHGETVQRTFVAPVEFRNVPAELSILDPFPAEVRVTLSGPARAFDLLNPDDVVISIDAAGFQEGIQRIDLTGRYLDLPFGLSVMEIRPSAVHLEARQESNQQSAVKK